jgi:Domain of unknown function (DUF4203)
MSISKFMHDYPYVFGVLLICLGPVVALYGRRFFPWVICGIISSTLFLGVLVFSSVVGLMQSTSSLIITVIGAAVFAAIAGKLSMKTVWFAVGILGLIGGFFIGSLIFTILIALGGFKPKLWLMIFFNIVCAVCFGMLSFKFSKQVVLVCTSLIGSYAFMRGLTYFIGGYPAEADIYE